MALGRMWVDSRVGVVVRVGVGSIAAVVTGAVMVALEKKMASQLRDFIAFSRVGGRRGHLGGWGGFTWLLVPELLYV